MKQCPKCRLLFDDGNLRFCRFDGSALISAGVAPDESATILFTSGHLNNRFIPLHELRRRSEAGKRHGRS